MSRVLETGKNSVSPAEMRETSEHIGRLLRKIGAARERLALSSDEALIFLALGALGISASSAGISITPVTACDVSEVLLIPRETVRRKAMKLAELELTTQTTRGFLLRNVDEWKRVAEIFR